MVSIMLWHLPLIAYHSSAYLAVSDAIERQNGSACLYFMPADVHQLICPGAIKLFQAQRLYLWRMHAFQLSLMEFMPPDKIG